MRMASLGSFFLSAAVAAAAPLTFSSGTTRVDLIELYTSEGCSSCPPAEAWMGELLKKPGLWTEFVPVAFHVNYWDHLGWRDRLSSRAYTDREYAYASAWGSGTVYTPCFVRNGMEWKPRWGGAPAVRDASGTLVATISGDGACQVEFRPAPGAEEHRGVYRAHVALLGFGISSKVTAGENRGETLGHEFAVLGIEEANMEDRAGTHATRVTLPAPAAPESIRRAVAVWVSRSGDLEPLQATGGWIP